MASEKMTIQKPGLSASLAYVICYSYHIEHARTNSHISLY